MGKPSSDGPAQRPLFGADPKDDERLREVYRHMKLRNRQALLKEMLLVKERHPGLITVGIADAVVANAFADASRITDVMRMRDIMKAFPGMSAEPLREAALRSDDHRAMLLGRREFGLFTDEEILARADVPKLLEVVMRKKSSLSSSNRYRDDNWVKAEIAKIPDLADLMNVGKVLES